MEAFSSTLFIAGSLLIAGATCSVIPKDVYDACSLSDPELNKCLVQKLTATKPFIQTGVPELNIPTLDPFNLDEIDIDHKFGPTMFVKGVLKNLKAYGGSGIIFDDIKLNPQTLEGEVMVSFPYIYAETEYNIQGQFLIPIQRRGYFRGNFTDVKVVGKGYFRKVTKNGVEIAQLEKPDFVAKIGDGYVKLTDKNPAQQMLVDMVANFFNQNPAGVVEILSPVYIRTITTYGKQLINSILTIIPFNELLKD